MIYQARGESIAEYMILGANTNNSSSYSVAPVETSTNNNNYFTAVAGELIPDNSFVSIYNGLLYIANWTDKPAVGFVANGGSASSNLSIILSGTVEVNVNVVVNAEYYLNDNTIAELGWQPEKILQLVGTGLPNNRLLLEIGDNYIMK